MKVGLHQPCFTLIPLHSDLRFLSPATNSGLNINIAVKPLPELLYPYVIVFSQMGPFYSHNLFQTLLA